MTRLVMVRHGEAQAAIDGVVGGPVGDTGLTELGRRQAAALRDRFKSQREIFDVLLTSTLPRAIETAAIVAPVLGGLVAIEDCELCELHTGDADGITWDEYREQYGATPMREQPHVPFAPGGESLRDFDERARRVLEMLAERHPDDAVLMVAHGGLISAISQRLLGRSIVGSDGLVLAPANTSITEWVTSEGHPGRWQLERYNDAGHLEGLEPVTQE